MNHETKNINGVGSECPANEESQAIISIKQPKVPSKAELEEDVKEHIEQLKKLRGIKPKDVKIKSDIKLNKKNRGQNNMIKHELVNFNISKLMDPKSYKIYYGELESQYILNEVLTASDYLFGFSTVKEAMGSKFDLRGISDSKLHNWTTDKSGKLKQFDMLSGTSFEGDPYIDYMDSFYSGLKDGSEEETLSFFSYHVSRFLLSTECASFSDALNHFFQFIKERKLFNSDKLNLKMLVKILRKLKEGFSAEDNYIKYNWMVIKMTSENSNYDNIKEFWKLYTTSTKDKMNAFLKSSKRSKKLQAAIAYQKTLGQFYKNIFESFKDSNFKLPDLRHFYSIKTVLLVWVTKYIDNKPLPTCEEGGPDCDDPQCSTRKQSNIIQEFYEEYIAQYVEMLKGYSKKMYDLAVGIMSKLDSILGGVLNFVTSITAYFKDLYDRHIKPIITWLTTDKPLYEMSVTEVVSACIFFLLTIVTKENTALNTVSMMLLFLALRIPAKLFNTVKSVVSFVYGYVPTDDDSADYFEFFTSIFTEQKEKSAVAVCGIILVAILGVKYSSTMHGNLWKIVNENFKNLHFFGAGLFGIERILKYSRSLINMVKEYIQKYVLKTKSETEFKADDVNAIANWATAVRAFKTDEGIRYIRSDSTMYPKIEELQNQGLIYYRRTLDGTIPRELIGEVQRTYRECRDLYNIVTKLFRFGRGRPTPFHVQFYGKAGVGKSTMVQDFINRLGSYYYPNSPKETLVYTRNTQTDHWDGYCGQKILVKDEAYPVKDALQLVEDLAIVNCHPLLTPQAELHDKGGIYLESDFYISTTNIAHPTCPDVYCMNAVLRRRHILAEVKCDPRVLDKSTSKFDKTKFDKYYPGQDSHEFPHISISIMKSVIGKGEDGYYAMGDVLPSGLSLPLENLTYKQFIGVVDSRRSAMRREEQVNMGLSDRSQRIKMDLALIQQYVKKFKTMQEGPMPRIFEGLSLMPNEYVGDNDFSKFYEEYVKSNMIEDPNAPSASSQPCADDEDALLRHAQGRGTIQEAIQLGEGNDTIAAEIAEMQLKIEDVLPDALDKEKESEIEPETISSEDGQNILGADVELDDSIQILEASLDISGPATFNPETDNMTTEQMLAYEHERKEKVLSRFRERNEESCARVRHNIRYPKEIMGLNICKKYDMKQHWILDKLNKSPIKLTEVDPAFVLVLEEGWRERDHVYLSDNFKVLTGVGEQVMSRVTLYVGTDYEYYIPINPWVRVKRNNKIVPIQVGMHFARNLEYDDQLEAWTLKQNFVTSMIGLPARYNYGNSGYSIAKFSFIGYLKVGTNWQSYVTFMSLSPTERLEVVEAAKRQYLLMNIIRDFTAKKVEAAKIVNERIKEKIGNTWAQFRRYLGSKIKIIGAVTALIIGATSVWALTKLFSKEPTSRVHFPKGIKKTGALPCNEEIPMMSIRSKLIKSIHEVNFKRVNAGQVMSSANVNVLRSGRYMITSAHLLDTLNKRGLEGEIYFSIRPTEKEDVEWDYCLRTDHIYLVPNKDLAVIYTPHLPPAIDLHKYFMDESDWQNYELPQHFVSIHKRKNETFVLQHDNIKIHTEGITYNTDCTYAGPYVTFKGRVPVGASGMPIIAQLPKGGIVIPGIMSCKTAFLNYATVFRIEDFKGAEDYFKKFSPVKFNGYFGIMEEVIPEEQKDFLVPYTPTSEEESFYSFQLKDIPPYRGFENFVTSHVQVVGAVRENSKILGVVAKTSYIETPIFKNFQTKRIPAILSVRDVRVPFGAHPLAHSINKTGRDIIRPPDNRLLKTAIVMLVDWELSLIDLNNIKVFDDISTVIRGCSDTTKPIETKTSPGIPYVYTKGRLPGKKEWLRYDILGNIEYLSPELEASVWRYDNHLRHLQVPSLSCYEFPKDELRPIEKALGPPIKTRSVTVMPMEITFLYRKYFMAEDSELHKLSDGRFPGSVGLNIQSMDWTNMYRKLKKVSSYGCDLDVGNWDGHWPAWLSEATLITTEEIYNLAHTRRLRQPRGTEDKNYILEKNARKGIMDVNLFAPSQFHDIILQKWRGLSSGFPGTADKNTKSHILLIIYFYLESCAETKGYEFMHLQAFRKYVCYYVYGDDIVIAISPDIFEHFNYDILVEKYQYYGWPCTSADKSDKIRPKKIEDLQFLKHTFKPDHIMGEAWIHAALDKEVIEDLCYWMRKSTKPATQFYENLFLALEYAFDHGPTYFNDLRQRIMDSCALEDIDMILPDYYFYRLVISRRVFDHSDP